jgi:hypothetical protein
MRPPSRLSRSRRWIFSDLHAAPTFWKKVLQKSHADDSGNFAFSFSVQVALHQINTASENASPVQRKKQECRMPTSKPKSRNKSVAKVIAMPVTPAVISTAPMPKASAVVLPMRPKPIAAKHAVKKAAAKKARKVVAKAVAKKAMKKAAPKKMAAAAVKKPSRKVGPKMKK